MGKKKDVNLRKKCLTNNFLRRTESVRCPKQDIVNEPVVDAPVHCPEDLPHSSTNPGEQQSNTQNAEQKIVGEIPSKRLLEDASMPSKKKRRILNNQERFSQERGINVGDISTLPQVEVPAKQKCQPIPDHVLSLYVEADQILDNVERDIDTFFEDDDDEEEEEDENKSWKKYSTSNIASADDADLAFTEITTFQQRHEYKKFFNKNLLLGRRLKDGVELSNEYLLTLRQAVKLLPPCSNHIPKLIAKFNKALSSYKANPVHKQLKTVCRNLVLVRMLITKFNNKHGLTSDSVREIRRRLES